MAKTTKLTPARACKCTKCGLEVGSAMPGKPHRKCGGQEGKPPRDHGDYIPGADRGEWA